MNDLMRAAAGEGRDYYRLYFQEPGVAEAELEADIARSVRAFLYSISGDVVADGVHSGGWDGFFPAGERFIDQLPVPDTLPGWLTETDVAFYAGELTEVGFPWRAQLVPLHQRVPDRARSLRWCDVRQPALYLGGELDLIAGNTPEALAGMQAALPNLRGCHILPALATGFSRSAPPKSTTHSSASSRASSACA